MRLATALLTALILASCGESSPPPVETSLLRWSDLDGAARRYLLEHPVLGPELGGPSTAPAGLQRTLRDWRDRAERRVPAALDYDLPALVRYVVTPPFPLSLGEAEVRRAREVPYGAALLLLQGGGGDPYLEGVLELDPTGLRPWLLEDVLRRAGLEPASASAADLAGPFQQINAFLAGEEHALREGQETSDNHFLDWSLKTTAMTGLPVKIGLVTDRLLGALATRSPRPRVRRALIVGPGIDLASPHLGGLAPVATYQPYELLDGLLGHGLAQPGELQVDCLDINPRVLDVIDQARRRGVAELALFRFVHGRLAVPEIEEYLSRLLVRFAEEPGFERSPEQTALSPDVVIRSLTRIPPGLPADQVERMLRRIEREARVRYRILRLPPAALDAVGTIVGDVVSDSFAPDDTYDLVLCTNVLNYFSPVQRDLALLNLRRVTRRGGLLITTESVGESVGEVLVGWRLLRREEFRDWDPQFLLECVQPPR